LSKNLQEHLLREQRHKLEDKVKMDIKETEYEDVDRIYLAQDVSNGRLL
jgi:phage gp16-like protein